MDVRPTLARPGQATVPSSVIVYSPRNGAGKLNNYGEQRIALGRPVGAVRLRSALPHPARPGPTRPGPAARERAFRLCRLLLAHYLARRGPPCPVRPKLNETEPAVLRCAVLSSAI